MNRTVTVLLAAAMLSAVGVTSYAVGSTSSAVPTVRGCVAKKAGTFYGVKHLKGDTRIIAAGSCYGWERAVVWNQRGVQGAPGKPGSPAPTPTATPTPDAQETLTATGTAMNTPAEKDGTVLIAPGDTIKLVGLSTSTSATPCSAGESTVTGVVALKKSAGGSVTLFTIGHNGPTSSLPATVNDAGILTLTATCNDRSDFTLGVTYTRTPAS